MQTETVLNHIQTSNTPPEIFHLFCCDRDIALCGEDITDTPVTSGDEDQACVVCHDLDHENYDCPEC